MTIACNFYRTTVGKKVVMALSGAVLVGFVLAHMAGNLKIFAGRNTLTGEYFFDHYARLLREIGEDFLGHGNLLWIARAVLLLCVLLHAWSGIALARANRAAKPVIAQRPDYRASNAASRTMLYGGLFISIFIIFHILHFTTGTLHFAGFVEGKVYSNVYSGFQNKLVAGFYVTAMIFLAMHLYHGVWSMFQTLGINSPQWNCGVRFAAKAISIVIFIGFSAVPLSVVFGLLPPP